MDDELRADRDAGGMDSARVREGGTASERVVTVVTSELLDAGPRAAPAVVEATGAGASTGSGAIFVQ